MKNRLVKRLDSLSNQYFDYIKWLLSAVSAVAASALVIWMEVTI